VAAQALITALPEAARDRKAERKEAPAAPREAEVVIAAVMNQLQRLVAETATDRRLLSYRGEHRQQLREAHGHLLFQLK
jgi:hypothetical protein